MCGTSRGRYSRHRRAPPAFKRACGKFCFHATRPPCVPARGAQRPARARRQGTRRQGSTWVGIRQTPPTPDGTSPRSRRPGQRWASCEQCASARPRWPRRTVTNRCVVRPLPLSVCFTVRGAVRGSEGYGVREWRVRTKQDPFFMSRTEFWAHASRRPPFQSSVLHTRPLFYEPHTIFRAQGHNRFSWARTGR